MGHENSTGDIALLKSRNRVAIVSAVIVVAVAAVVALYREPPRLAPHDVETVTAGNGSTGAAPAPMIATPPAPASTVPPAPSGSLASSSIAPSKVRTRSVRTILIDDPPQAGCTPEEAARRALERHEKELAPAGWARGLASLDVRKAAGGTVVRFGQMSEGVPVLGGGAIVLLDSRGRATYASVQALPGLPAGMSSVPSVSADEARASAELDFEVEDGVTSQDPGLYVVPDEPSATLAWVVPVSTEEPFGSYSVLVDAHTAAVVESRDVLKTATGHGKIFNPNPVASTGNFDLRDDFDRSTTALDSALVDGELTDLDGSGFLRGPLVDVITGDETERVSNNNLEFNFRRSDPGFEQTMCYAYLGLALNYCAQLGRPNPLERTLITKARFSSKGEEELNAFYDPNTEFLSFGTKGVDLAEDGTVILHELGHALQDAAARQGNRPFGLSYEGGAMGEGFGDFWALSVLADKLTTEPNFIGHWVTYGDLDFPFGQAFFASVHRRVDSDKIWPRDADPGRDPHLDGEIWSAGLWQIRNLLGRDDANKLVLESHYLLQPEAEFQDGSLALIAANNSLFGGTHQAEIEAILHERGVFDPDGTSSEDDGFEENDSPVEAADVLFGQTSVEYDDLVSLDDDWYLVPAKIGQVVDIAIQFVNANGDLDMAVEVLDQDAGELLNVGVSATDQNLERLTIDTRGVLRAFGDEEDNIYFFVFVQGFEGATNDYALGVNLAEPTTSQEVVDLALGDTFEANASVGDVDIVQFEGLEGTVVSVQTKKKGSAGGVVEAALVSEETTIFDFGAGVNARGVRQSASLPATGIYTLFLRGVNGATGPYALKLKGKAPKVKFKETITFDSDEEFGSFEADALAGSHLILKAKAKGKNSDGSKLQPLVGFFDGEGNLLGAAGAPEGGTTAVIDLPVAATGSFFGVVTPATGSFGTATVTAQLKLPKSKRVLRETLD